MGNEAIDSRLDGLLARAAKAQELATEIDRLRKADPHRPDTSARLNWQGQALLDEPTLKRLIDAGRKAMIEALENQLAAILEGV